MIAVLGGLGAALMWAASTLCSSRSARMLGAPSVLAWVMAVGLALNLVLLAVVRPPVPTDAPTICWLTVGGAGNVAGLLLAYSALRVGKVGLVAPITSTEGALAALIAVLAGEPLGVSSAVLLLVITCGVVLAAAAPELLPVAGENKGAAVWLAVGAAVAFGLSLYATGHVSSTVAMPWVLLPPRALGFVALTLPLALSRRLRLTRAALPLVAASGVAEVIGFASYAAGARHSIAVAAVLASQFAAFAGVGAYVLFRERLTRLQLTGVVIVIAGVTALSAARA
jgi:drug/metabolite transporter (DMT)-like permease